MKRKTKFFVVLAVIAILNLFFQLRVENGAAVVSHRQAMATEVVYYGIIEGEATVTCSGGESGRCFEQRVGQPSSYQLDMFFYCQWTGSMSNYCSLLLNYAANWFFNYVGI